MTSWWQKSKTIADSESLTADTAVEVDISDIRQPTVLATLTDDEGNGDDTLTIGVKTDVGEFGVHEISVAEDESVVAAVPQADTLQFNSLDGSTYNAVVVANEGKEVTQRNITRPGA